MISLPARLSRPMIAEVRRLAEAAEVSVSQWIRDAVRDRINRENAAEQNSTVPRESTH